MFEQSILLDGPAARKTGAFVASLAAQMAAAGVLILVPLMYSDTLPRVRLSVLPMLSPSAPPPPEPPVHEAVVPRGSNLLTRSAPPFVMRTAERSAVSAAAPMVMVADAQIIGDSVGPSFQPPTGALPQIEKPPTPSAPAATPSPAPVPVGGDVQAAKIIRKVVPLYPALARSMRVSGTVKLMGVVAKDGTIQKLQVLSGHPFLVPAALDAVKQWVYRPTLLNGQPVEVIAPIDVIFTLQ